MRIPAGKRQDEVGDLSQALAAWQASRNDRERLFDLSIDLFCVAGNGYFKVLNASWEKTTGFTRAELMAKPTFDFYHPDDQQAVNTEIQQGLMATLGATLGKISPGAVEIEIRPHPAISQQHGFIHAAAVSAIAEPAAGYAALSLMPDGRGVLTTESGGRRSVVAEELATVWCVGRLRGPSTPRSRFAGSLRSG